MSAMCRRLVLCYVARRMSLFLNAHAEGAEHERDKQFLVTHLDVFNLVWSCREYTCVDSTAA